MTDRLVVPLDGSPTSSRVLPGAVLLARAIGVPIRLVAVQSPRVDVLEAITMLERAVEELDAPALAPSVLEDDDVARALLEHVVDDGSALLCMSSHGRTGLARAVLGSTTASVLARSTVPVVVIGPRAEPRAGLDVIEVVVDPGADDHAGLVTAALGLARPGARLHLDHVGRVAGDLLVGERLRCEDAGVETACDVLPGHDVVTEIVDAAATHEAALLALAGARPSVFGSVVEQVVHRAPCPVLVVPPQPDCAAEERRGR